MVPPTQPELSACLDAEIPGAINFRDLGGFRTPEGSVRHGRVFRSAMTQNITDEGFARLRERYGVARVFDLRSQIEVERDGLARFEDHGIERHHLVVRGASALTPDDRRSLFRQMLERDYDWGTHYRSYVGEHADSYVTLIRILSGDRGPPAIIHCSGGRDRTGVACALILETLGVTAEDIAADYAKTGGYLAAHVDTYAARRNDLNLTAEDFKALFATEEEDMLRFLDWLQATHGGAERFLLSAGVPAGELERLRQALTVT